MCYKTNFAIKLNFLQKLILVFFYKKKKRRDLMREWEKNFNWIIYNREFFFYQVSKIKILLFVWNWKNLIIIRICKIELFKKNERCIFFLSLYSAWNNIWHNIRKLFIKKERFKKNIFYYYSDNYFVPMELVLIEFTNMQNHRFA